MGSITNYLDQGVLGATGINKQPSSWTNLNVNSIIANSINVNDNQSIEGVLSGYVNNAINLSPAGNTRLPIASTNFTYSLPSNGISFSGNNITVEKTGYYNVSAALCFITSAQASPGDPSEYTISFYESDTSTHLVACSDSFNDTDLIHSINFSKVCLLSTEHNYQLVFIQELANTNAVDSTLKQSYLSIVYV